MSVSGTVVVAMQDVLRLGNEARMNTPGVAAGNWAWRVGPAGVFSTLHKEARDLRSLAARYGRLPHGASALLEGKETDEADEA